MKVKAETLLLQKQLKMGDLAMQKYFRVPVHNSTTGENVFEEEEADEFWLSETTSLEPGETGDSP